MLHVITQFFRWLNAVLARVYRRDRWADLNRTVYRIDITLLAVINSGCGSSDVPDLRDNDYKHSPRASGKLGDLQDCMEAAGWEVEYEGGILSGPLLPSEQAELYDEDNDRCAAQTHFFDPMVADDYHRLYRLEVASYKCLLEHGYDSDEPPSEQQFVEDWLAADSLNYEPYQAIGLVFKSGDIDAFRAATTVCPPPLWSF